MNYLSVVDSCFFDHPGGTAKVAWDIALLMKENKHDVTMICKNTSNQPSMAEIEGIKIIRYKPTKTKFNLLSGISRVNAACNTGKELLTKKMGCDTYPFTSDWLWNNEIVF